MYKKIKKMFEGIFQTFIKLKAQLVLNYMDLSIIIVNGIKSTIRCIM